MFQSQILDRISLGIHESAVKFNHQERERLIRMAAECELLQKLADLRERLAENRAIRGRSPLAA